MFNVRNLPFNQCTVCTLSTTNLNQQRSCESIMKVEMAGALRNGTSLYRLKARTPAISLCKALSIKQSLVSEGIEKRESAITRKLTALVKWYEEITGMDEVRRAQNRVLEAEEKFIDAQERRREANKAVTEIQAKLKDLHAALDSTTRGEDRYVQLITQEHQILKEERRLTTEFQQFEREEREYFSVLSSAVKESHEQERAQAEKTKYWSIIGSVIGTIIGVVGSSINNSLKMKELRKLIKDSVTNSSDSLVIPTEILPKYEEQLSAVVSKLKTVALLSDDEVIKRLKNVVNSVSDKAVADGGRHVGSKDYVAEALDRQTALIEKKFQELESTMVLHHIPNSELRDESITVVTNGLEERLQGQQHATQLLVVGSALLIITFPYMLKYIGLT